MSEYNVHLMQAMVMKGYSFRTLADKVGIASSTLRAYARRDSKPNSDLVFTIADALDVDPRWLWIQEPTSFELREASRLSEILRKTSVRGD